MQPDTMMAVLNERLNEHPPEHRPLVADLVMTQLVAQSAANRGSLNKTDWAYQNYADLVLALGTVRRAAVYVPDTHAELQDMELGQCFYNAYIGAVDLGFQYVEGYAQTEILAVQHAWLEDDEGRIIDPTWAHLNLPIDFQCTYAGIRFDTDFVLEAATETGWCSILARDWEHGNPALKRGFITNEQGVVIARA